MSWQQYVDGNLIGSGKIASAAILGHDGNTWATSKGFAVKPDEGKKIIQGFKDPSGLLSGGVMLNGQKYLMLRSDDRSIYAKKGAGGAVIVKTAQAVLIGVYGENSQPGEATIVVEQLGDYLRSVNF